MKENIQPFKKIPAKILLLALFTSTVNSQDSFVPTVVLGGLFPIHRDSDNPDKPCGPMFLEKGYQRVEAMLYAIDQINANTSYWNFKMEAVLLDTCVSESHALEQARKFMLDTCEMGESRKVAAVVGASNSEVSIAVANIFSLFQIPQVSYASTSLKLDDVDKYSNFFRVVPSDRFQVEAILDILLKFGWSYVSMIISKGEYGESAAQYLRDRIRNTTSDKICIAKIEVLPKSAGKDDFDAAVRRLDSHGRSKVVIVFLNEEKIKPLFEACARCSIPKDRFIWIGSDGWGVKKNVVEFSKHAEGAITIHPRGFSVPGFDEYFLSLKPSTTTQNRNPWFKEYWEQKNKVVNWRKNYQQGSYVPMVIDSVFLLAAAIRAFCLKNERLCDTPDRWSEKYKELVNFIQNTTIESAQGHDLKVSFDENRSVPVNYTIYQYRVTKTERPRSITNSYKDIGEWNPDKRLTISENPKWFTETGEEIPKPPMSSCNELCEPGFERVSNPDFPGLSCCWSCRECPLYSFLPKPEEPCRKCPDGQFPTFDKKSCADLPVVFLGKDLKSAWALVPLIFSVLGIICTCAVFAVFLIYHKTPIIMASGRELCHVILVGIILCYCFAFIVLLKPTKVSCGSLRVTMGLGLSMCYSAIFTKTNRISRIFDVSVKSLKRPSYISPESQIVICLCLIFIQLTLTVLWLIVKPAGVENGYFDQKEWMLYCNIDDVSVLLGLLFNMVLLLLCTVYAYKTRNIPENFNETKWISFTMYSSCIVWLAFIPIYYNKFVDYRVKATVLSMSVMLSGTVTLVCIFLPKIYIVLFHPERNVRFPSSSGTGTGTETFDNGTHVRYLRTDDPGQRQPSPTTRPDSPFIFRRTENNVPTSEIK